ncbi:MAG: NUDIX domain-containing protein [Pseudoruegeria sp.]
MSFSESYLGKLRLMTGSIPLLVVGARVLIEDDKGRFLIIRRADSGDWGLPGGAMELGESLMDVVFREALEETSASLKDVTAFGLSSNPKIENHTYPNGDKVQNISLLAHGYLANDHYAPNDGEATEVKFMNFDDIHKASFVSTELPTFYHWQSYKKTGQFQIV